MRERLGLLSLGSQDLTVGVVLGDRWVLVVSSPCGALYTYPFLWRRRRARCQGAVHRGQRRAHRLRRGDVVGLMRSTWARWRRSQRGRAADTVYSPSRARLVHSIDDGHCRRGAWGRGIYGRVQLGGGGARIVRRRIWRGCSACQGSVEDVGVLLNRGRWVFWFVFLGVADICGVSTWPEGLRLDRRSVTSWCGLPSKWSTHQAGVPRDGAGRSSAGALRVLTGQEGGSPVSLRRSRGASAGRRMGTIQGGGGRSAPSTSERGGVPGPRGREGSRNRCRSS